MKYQKRIATLLIFAGFVLQLGIFQNVSAQFEFKGDEYGHGFVEDTKQFFSDLGDVLGVEGGGGEATSFTQFTGGLEAPSTEGYAPGLTQATDARTYILNVTNFVLGFLGLIAILVVIYGGFMYVTAAGKEDQAATGKKSITYAIIGILIITGSFAIVNTVLQAPSGTEGTRGSAEGQQVAGQTVQTRFNVLAGRAQTVAREIISAYAFHFEAKNDLRTANQLVIEAFERITFCSENGCGDDWNDGLLEELNQFKPKIDNAASILERIRVNIPKTSIDAISINAALTDLNTYLNNIWSPALNRASARADQVGCGTEIEESCEGPENESVYKEFLGGDNSVQTEYDDLFVTAQNAVLSNFGSTINNQKRQLKEMYDLIRPVTDVADDEFGALVLITDLQKQGVFGFEDLNNSGGSLQELKEAVNNFQDLTPASGTEPHTKLGTTVNDLATLFNVLKNIAFVDARLSASLTEGNAPVVVNFSSVGSLDPSGITLQDSQISWDLDGNGTFDELSNENCKEEKKATVSCLYTIPGTYRVRLKIAPSSENNPLTGRPYNEEIGTGIATINIKVNPPQTKINLAVDNVLNSGQLWIIKYSNGGFIELNRSSVIVPLSKAQTGIKFNATLTEAREGILTEQAGEGATVLWDFGDGSTVSADDPGNVNKVLLSASADNLSPTHKFTKEGTYTISIEVTDKAKTVDRKLFSLIVASLVPQVQISNQNPKVGERVTFDGSNSVSENGQITDYEWLISPEPDPAISAEDKKKATFDYVFTKPGNYKISLRVTDNIAPDPVVSPQETITVESQPPVAQFSYEITDPSQPGTVKLDGSKSYDPDGVVNQKLNYLWEVNGQELSKTAVAKIIDNKDLAKPVIKFTEEGNYVVTLTVTDPNGRGSNVPQDSLPVEKEIAIDNVLDIAWEKNPNDTDTAFIKKNDVTGQFEAMVSLTLASEKGRDYEIDFGDGETGNGSINPTSKEAQISHPYKEPGTYIVKANVFDEENNENTLTRKIYIGSADNPVAAFDLKINGQEFIDTGVPLKVNRQDIITFDATKSLNIDGTGRRLNYNWKLDGNPFNSKKDFTYTFKELKTAPYKVQLEVTNANDVSKKSINEASVEIEVMGQPPTLSSIAVVPASASPETPVNVQANALGASDEDGKIVSYRWWYFPAGTDGQDPANQLGLQITSNPTANMVIGTRGASGESVSYQFAVELTDNENNKFNSLEANYVTAPELEVINGPNDEPVAKFNVDRTSIFAGESVEFSSSSSDPDGQIVKYLWDFEGNGFADDDEAQYNKPNVTYIFNKGAKDGIRVRLKVIDDKGSEAVSDPVTIYVDSNAVPPVAAFTTQVNDKNVSFTDTSTADAANGANIVEWVWDFDINVDSNGDGKKDNDNDAGNVTTKNPTHEYADYGIYRAKLIVKDNLGASAMVTNFVNVKEPLKPSAPQPPAPPPTALDARLITTPAASFADGKIHLKGESGTVILDYSTSTGSIKTYLIDKNIYFDTNGNGIKEDDEDYKSSTPGKWTTDFAKTYGNIRVRLTVVDSAGKKDFVDKDIVFDPATPNAEATYMANIFGVDASALPALLVSIGGFAILTLSLLRLKKKNKKI